MDSMFLTKNQLRAERERLLKEVELLRGYKALFHTYSGKYARLSKAYPIRDKETGE